jgi:hypothetical protein
MAPPDGIEHRATGRPNAWRRFVVRRYREILLTAALAIAWSIASPQAKIDSLSDQIVGVQDTLEAITKERREHRAAQDSMFRMTAWLVRQRCNQLNDSEREVAFQHCGAAAYKMNRP